MNTFTTREQTSEAFASETRSDRTSALASLRATNECQCATSHQMLFAFGQAHERLKIVKRVIRDERIPSYDLACIIEAVLEGEDNAEEESEA